MGEVLQASGECIKACNYGVNPRFLLTMARLSMMRYDKEPAQRRRAGVNQFRKVGEDVGVLSRLQLSEGDLDSARPKTGERSTSCRVPGRSVLHRRQRAQDAAHRAALPRHNGRDRHRLSAHGRADPLLRHRPASAGGRRREHRRLPPGGYYKTLKIKQDVDAIITNSADLMKRHGVDLDTARDVIVNGMLGDQPLPLQGAAKAESAAATEA